VTGVDASPDMLDRLRVAATEQGAEVEPVEADIVGYDDGREYGLVFCVCGTLSMVLDPDDQRRVLEACARAAAPGAAVVIETHHPAGVEAMHDGRARDSFFTPYPGGDRGLLSHSTLDPAAGVWQLAHVWFADGRTRVATEVSRLTTPDEVEAYAAAAGLVPEARWGAWDGSPLRGPEPTYVSVFRRPA
jgi:SAM-dependent methyltransferase